MLKRRYLISQAVLLFLRKMAEELEEAVTSRDPRAEWKQLAVLRKFGGWKGKKGRMRAQGLPIRKHPDGHTLVSKGDIAQDTLEAFASVENADIISASDLCDLYNASQAPPSQAEIDVTCVISVRDLTNSAG